MVNTATVRCALPIDPHDQRPTLIGGLWGAPPPIKKLFRMAGLSDRWKSWHFQYLDSVFHCFFRKQIYGGAKKTLIQFQDWTLGLNTMT